IEQGASLAAISREAGLNKDWLSRHLGCVDPVVAEAVRRLLPNRTDARWQPALTRLGYPDVPSYLRERHIRQHWTVHAIPAHIGQHCPETATAGAAALPHPGGAAALRRHGLAGIAPAAKRHQAHPRPPRAAARLGFDSMTDYVASRRGAGWTWRAMAAECAQP